VRHRKNAELVIRGALSLYGEGLALGRVRVKASPERLSELEEGQAVGVRALAQPARRRGRWEILGRQDLIEVLPY
jgi:hypothetical protein